MKKKSDRMPGYIGMDAEDGGEIVLYQTEDGSTRLEVRLLNETVWLSQKMMAELFQKDVRTINEHIRNIFSEKELKEEAVIRNFRITAADGKAYETLTYNLDVIISVGYRVKSHRGTQFRIWATQRLREYIVKGFTLDDARLREGNSTPAYFDELLRRIRDIRASERNFYRKVQDIYTTSIDYDPASPIAADFFAMIQNKMHWAVHGKTAAEIIAERADAAMPNMGLTTWKGSKVRKTDTTVAKNYLAAQELELLNLIVSQYLDFAELQARSKKVMYMRDWAKKLDDFLRVNDRDVLRDAGKISAKMAEELAYKEYEKYEKRLLTADSSSLHPDLENHMRTISVLPAPKPPSRKGKKKL
jgi:hypothetical protein